MWYAYPMEYYLAKKSEILFTHDMNKTEDHYNKCNKPGGER